jgi:hypothetical protein
MTDKERFLSMLAGSVPFGSWQSLRVREVGRCVVIDTGPDDAGAVFGFSSDGTLKMVSVVEAHADSEAAEWTPDEPEPGSPG